MKGGSPAPVRDGGAEAVDEQDGRALSPGEVVHAHPAPRPGGAAPAQLLQGQRRRGGWGRRAAGAAAAARGARDEDAVRGSGAETAMGRRPRGEGERGEAAAAARSCRSSCGGEGEEAGVVGGKCCHILRPLGSVVVAGVPFLRLLSWHDHARGRRVSFTYSTFGHLKLLKNS